MLPVDHCALQRVVRLLVLAGDRLPHFAREDDETLSPLRRVSTVRL